MESAELYKKSKREAISELLHEIECVSNQEQYVIFVLYFILNYFFFSQRLRDVTTSVPTYKDLTGVMMTR